MSKAWQTFRSITLQSWFGVLLIIQAIVTGVLWFRFPILIVSYFVIVCLYAIDYSTDFDQEWIAAGLAVLFLTWLFTFFASGG